MTPGRPGGSQPGRPVRVLVLDHTGELGGAELALVRLLEVLGPDVDVRVLLFSDGPLVARLRAAGAVAEVLPLDPGTASTSRTTVGRAGLAQLVSLARLVPFTWALSRRVRALRPDVVHTTSLKADVLGVVPARVARAALVWHVHDRIADDYLPPRVARVVRWASARFPAEVVVNSRATASTLPGPSTVAYPGFAAEQVRLGGRPPAGRPPVVGMIGRVSPTKGQLELVRAARRVLDEHPDATFRVVGEPSFGAEEYAEQVRAEAVRLGVAERFVWAGFVADPSAELDGFDVCVHASPVPEPFGQVVVEAMVREVPVVATRAGGVVEILAGPANDPAPLGELVEPGDVESLARGISGVLADPEPAAVRARRAADVAQDRFAATRTAEVVSEVWRRAARPAR
ncbi:glycosyltransferase [Oerskovia sp. KBS0722]|uniref:glycosyltransferase n=1 Tax=Oerskovia sp. KBS0722 TaxID=1179673 RepID=UPI00143CFEEE|nr:glycosyltransferase [Oerskovia sp. KBS0722]